MKLPHIKTIFAFYGTVMVPVLYGLNLFLVSQANTMRVILTIRLVGLLAALAGLLVWLVSYFQLKRSFGVLPQKQQNVRTGLYGIVKHPMYLGILMTFFGLSFANQSKAGIMFTLIIMTPLLYCRALLEEKNLF